ncbi:regulatory LuxR family protein [Actinocrispum wychmicini]|uniref:Regulatory LuxR family protein n=1 Tax=Actinocrispum wychmicini TaxID=1213861 RepID=A0A4R2JAC9_9PSEU|nr:regulatory LuxR family protein [Actinocrispum wychmicini]
MGALGRERRVLAPLGAGHSNGEIADALHIVEGTVNAHISSILDKLNARNRVQAAILAYQAGLTWPVRHTQVKWHDPLR